MKVFSIVLYCVTVLESVTCEADGITDVTNMYAT